MAKPRHDPSQPQSPEDQPDYAAGYLNDSTGWVRGAHGEPNCFDEDATGKPAFDHSPARPKMRR